MHRTILGLASLLALMAPALCAPSIVAPRRAETGLVYDGIPEEPQAASDRLDEYLGARAARLLGWSPKGQLLIATRFGEVEELHLVGQPLGQRRQLTFESEPIRDGAYCPDPNRDAVVFALDRGGDELTQLYYQRLGESGPRPLTDGKSSNGGALWSNSGRALAFFSTARDGAAHDIDVIEPEGGALPRLVLAGDGAELIPLDWSPDDSKLLVLRRVSATESYLYVVDVDSGHKREVDPAGGKVGIVDARFSRDGQGVYLVSDRDADVARLRYVNLFTAERSVLSAAGAGDIGSLALSRDGHYLAFTSSEAGAMRLNLIDLRARQDLTPPRLPAAGVVGALRFDPESRRLAFDLASAARPRDVYVLDLGANRLEAWTASEAGAADGHRAVIPSLIEFPTFDRTDGKPRTLGAYVYQPSSAGPHPVLILLHGGPAAQFRPVFDPWLEYLVNELHFAVIAPNVRGSAGRGRTFLALDSGALRGDAVKDLGALLVWIDLNGDFDAKRVVIAGEGYGGALALAALVNYGERLRGAVDLGGITDFASFPADTAPERRDAARAEFGDERDPDTRAFLRRISPFTNADRITRPVLIVHGRHDRRVPIAQSEELTSRLRSRGGTVWLLEATNEGPELDRLTDIRAYYRTFAQFLETLR